MDCLAGALAGMHKNRVPPPSIYKCRDDFITIPLLLRRYCKSI